MGGGRGSPSMNGAAGPSTSSANSKHLVYGGGGGGGSGGSASGDYNNGAGGGMNSLSAGGGGSSGLSSSPTSSAGDKGALAQSGAAGGKAGKASGEQHPSVSIFIKSVAAYLSYSWTYTSLYKQAEIVVLLSLKLVELISKQCAPICHFFRRILKLKIDYT